MFALTSLIFIQQMSNGFTIGYATFLNEQRSKRLYSILTKEVIDTLQEQDQWWICHGQYVDQKWDIIFSEMSQAKTYKLELGRNLNSNIIREVCPINFSCLRALCFGKNKIQNIEMIAKINAPQLQWLSFQQNYITSLKPLRKAHFPNLKVINLKFNKIKQIELHELRSPYLSKVCLEFHYKEKMQCQILNWIFKLETKTFKIIRCRSQNRIVNTILEKQYAQKYKNFDFKKWDANNSNSQSQSDHQ